MTQSKKWAVLIAAPLLNALVCMFPPSAARAESTVISSVRIGSNPEYVRLVLESDRPLNPPPLFSLKRKTLYVNLAAIVNDTAVEPSGARSRDIVGLHILKVSDAVTRIQAIFSFAPRDVRTFSLTAPYRFIIDAYRPPALIPSDSTAARKEQPAMKPDGWLPRSTGARNHPASARIIRSAAGPSTVAGLPAASKKTEANASGWHGFRQSLLAALIGVTSTIIVLLLFWICFGSARKSPPESSWLDLLPPGRDPAVKHLDTRIAEKLNAIVAGEKDPAVDQQLTRMAEIIRLSHQKSELVCQRLEAVITALKKGKRSDGGV